jgi:seryl-tRNA synthetase
MLDPRTLSERRDEILESCRKRGVSLDLDPTIAAQSLVTDLQTAVNEAGRERNEHQQAGKGRLDADERARHTEAGRRLKQRAADLEAELAEARAALDARLATIPNLIHPDVPVGGEDEGRELRRVGEPPRFDFEVRDHLGVAQALDGIDFEAGARVAGQKWYYLKNDLVLLELALQRYALDVLLEAHFTPFVTPDVAKPEIVDGLGYSPRGPETQIYSLANADLCLVGTAEITLGGLHAGQLLEEDQLPLRVAGISHCFRTEAGSHGRESKGLYRVHQFTKVEMFVFTRPEDSDAMHEELLSLEERIFSGLEIPYRVVDIASGDLGAPAYRKYDLEAWMPGRGEAGEWGEVTSTSNCTDYQARRLRVRFRRKESKKNEHVHMLNGTAIANSRGIIALLENHQRADGTVAVPQALQPYVGREVLRPPKTRA